MYKDLKKETNTQAVNAPFGWSVADESQSNLSVHIDEEVFHKIMHWINKSDFECSGLGLIEIDKETNTFNVTDAILLKQTNSSVTTELSGDAVCKAMHELRLKGSSGSLHWWWHSHVNMDVFWSGTDKDAIKTLGGAGVDTKSWFLATVFNKREEMLSAFVSNHPIQTIQTGLKTEVVYAIDEDLMSQWDKEYEDKVESESFIGHYENFTNVFPSSFIDKQDPDYQEKINQSEDRLANIICKEGGWSVDDLKDAVVRGEITLDDVIYLHDTEDIDDDEFNYLFGSTESSSLDLIPVRQKHLFEI